MRMPVRLRIADGFRFLARAAGGAAILIGAAVLAGWALDIEAARRGIPGLVAMNPGGTALAILLAGVSLWIQAAADSRRLRALAIACAERGRFAGAASGSAAIWFAWDGGPDQLLFREKLDLEALRTGQPNRMAPNTAAALLLVGLALLLLNTNSRRGVLAAQLVALATVIIALLAIIGYAYQRGGTGRIEQFIPMALNTALVLGLLSVRHSLRAPDRGVMAVVTSGGAGGVMARRLLPAVIVIPPVVGWVCWLGRQDRVARSGDGAVAVRRSPTSSSSRR